MAERPDNWVVLKITTEKEVLYKVLAGWSGGYLGGSSWRLNSGIVEAHEVEEGWNFIGHSGSEYICSKGQYRLRMNNAGVYNRLKKEYGDLVELMPEDTDWSQL
jgi:hypothetical protein